MMHAVRVQPDAAQNLIVSCRQDQRDVFLQVWLEDFVDVWGVHYVSSLAFFIEWLCTVIVQDYFTTKWVRRQEICCMILSQICGYFAV